MNFMSGMTFAPSLQGRMEATPYTGEMVLYCVLNNLAVRDETGVNIARVMVDTLDANCGVCHVHHWNVNFLSKEQQFELLEYIELIAKKSTYGRIITGLNKKHQKNIAELLEKREWEKYDEFKSPRTGQTCVFYRKNLIEEAE